MVSVRWASSGSCRPPAKAICPGRDVSGSLGYNLRYWQWKSNIDTVHAGFRAGAAYQSWVAPLDGWQVLTSSGSWSYQSMKIRPQQLNSIFVPQVDAANCSVAFDQLLCNVNFQVYAVQNLDRNGLLLLHSFVHSFAPGVMTLMPVVVRWDQLLLLHR